MRKDGYDFPQVDIKEESIATIAEQANVSIAFQYDRLLELDIAKSGFGGLLLTEKLLAAPEIKEYDASEGDAPKDWSKRFDLKSWGFMVARSEGLRVGGAVIAYDCAEVNMIDRPGQAVLWDLRVAEDFRQQGIGALLFAAVEKWALERGCDQLKIETQNNNIAACKFYQRQGCELGAINRFAYPKRPDEIQLLWFKQLC
ncbi:MAG: GNAT family N-acetyltransferase [Candidatus Obscuribacterales bacterium]|nr:GNAT family N-acetyltransferase [Candidatus Obscuribacterales bacterium]